MQAHHDDIVGWIGCCTMMEFEAVTGVGAATATGAGWCRAMASRLTLGDCFTGRDWLYWCAR